MFLMFLIVSNIVSLATVPIMHQEIIIEYKHIIIKGNKYSDK